jgi:predicted dehydrogenase
MGSKKSRREFLGLSTAAGLGLTLGLHSCEDKYKPTKFNPNDKINVGLVGCGQRGIDQIWAGIKHLNEFQMVAICDVIEERLDKTGQLMPKGIKKYRDYRHLIANIEVDLVIVAVPLKWHFQISKAAILANKHVVCEKSMTFTIQEAIELEKIASEYEKSFRLSFEKRNNPAYGVAKELFDKNIIGEILHVDCSWYRRDSWRKDVTNPYQIIEFPTGEKMSREKLLNWRMSMDIGGGLMGELTCHQLDAVEWIMNTGHVEKVSGFGNIGFWKDGRTSYDNIHANLEYPNNLIITCNSILSNAREGYSISIYGRNGTIELAGNSGVFYPEETEMKKLNEKIDAVTGASYKLVKTAPERKLREDEENSERAYYGQFVGGYILDTLMGYKKMAAEIMNNGPFPNTAAEGKHNSIAVQMANNAMHQGGVHSWKPEYGI